ncbi:MAG TPA: ParA family protein [Thiotrichales bacterium]|nr:ParA family protein [Thiotrichales bacterium]
MPKIITICNAKGGTGKTTLAANLGGILAEAGHRVLLIDADVQPTLTSYFSIDNPSESGLTRLVQDGSLAGTISTTSVGCDLVRSDDPDARLQNWILHTPDGRFRLWKALRQPHPYDYILIDTQGAIGPLQDAAMLAADMVLSPVPPETLSAREFLRGTLDSLDKLSEFSFLGITTPPVHAVLYRMDRTVDARRIATQLREGLARLAGERDIRILDTVIRSAVAYREAATARKPVHRVDTRAGREIFRLAVELLGGQALEGLDGYTGGKDR